MQAVAKYKNCPIPPRKMRLVADNVRGLSVKKAFNILKFSRVEGAYWIERVLHSAVANWSVKNEGQSPDGAELIISEIRIDPGMMLKRFRPAPHGRAHRIRKRFNHITIVVDNLAPVELAEAVEEGDDEA
jgi:large subunit ribosomal protein L22